jgi:hypothetical protein
MRFLKKILRIGVSTFIPFVLLAKLGNTYTPYQANPVIHVSAFTLYDMRVFFANTAPVCFIAAFILQGLLVIPVWDWIFTKNTGSKIAFFAIMFVIIIAIAFGLGCIIWQPLSGFVDLTKSASVLVLIQFLYWMFNFVTLYLLDRFYFKKQRATVVE